MPKPTANRSFSFIDRINAIFSVFSVFRWLCILRMDPFSFCCLCFQVINSLSAVFRSTIVGCFCGFAELYPIGSSEFLVAADTQYNRLYFLCIPS